MRLNRRRQSYPAQPKSSLAMVVGFVPLIIFAILATVSQDLALWAAFAAAFVVGVRDFAHERVLRLLDVGSTIIFGGVAFFVGFVRPGLTIEMTRLTVDAAFFLLALLSIALRNPMTLQYACAHASAETRSSRGFVLANYGLTALWLFAFALAAAADAFADVHKYLPASLAPACGIAVLLVALCITARYPLQLRVRTIRVVDTPPTPAVAVAAPRARDRTALRR